MRVGAGPSRRLRRRIGSASLETVPRTSSPASSTRGVSSGASFARGARNGKWAAPDVLRPLPRASLAALRKEVEPVGQEALARFLPGWHGIDRRATLRETLIPLQGVSLPVALWESDVLPRRVPGFQPADLDQLTASG